jgi:hypothetical protein
MSSRKAAAARPAAKSAATKARASAKPAKAGKAAGKTVAKPAAGDPPPRVIRAAPKAPSVPDNATSAQARALAAAIERAIAADDNDVLSTEAGQKLMGALCKLYAAQVEAGSKETPVEEGQAVSPTGIMLTASGLLRAANLAVFELGMWQSWTGR